MWAVAKRPAITPQHHSKPVTLRYRSLNAPVFMRHYGGMNANSNNSIPPLYWPACHERSALALALNSANSVTVPDWILLIPAGTVVGVDGRSWVNDQPNNVVSLFNNRQLDLPIDWEHATEVRAPKGLDAPAAGWIQAMEVREGAVWGCVEWTAAGVNCISSKSYSPAWRSRPRFCPAQSAQSSYYPFTSGRSCP